jgi:hypothetical protein
MWLCGGGSTSGIGFSNVANSGTITANGAVNGYTWTNNTGGTITATFASIKTRNSG